MKSKSSKLKQLNILLVTLLILFGPFCLYYLFYVSNQRDYFISRNFRLLSVLGRGIEKKVDSIGAAYGTAAQRAALAYYKPANGEARCDENNQDLVRSRKSIVDSLGPSMAQQLDVEIKPADPKETRSEVTLDLRQQGKWLYFGYVASADKCPSLAVNTGTKLDDFVEPFFQRFPNGKDFDSVFLADTNGRVLYQWAPEEIALTNFGALIGKDQSKIDFDRLKQNGNVADVVIADTDFKLFVQPIELSLPRTNSQNSQSIEWVVGGLVRTGHLNSESRAISYTILIVITFLFVLIVLSFPFLKLIFMGAKDVLRVADMYFLAFSTLIGSALLTVFLVYALSYVNLENKMDEQLAVLSDRIVRNFEAEVGSASQQLEKLNDDCRLRSELTELREADKAEAEAEAKAERSPSLSSPPFSQTPGETRPAPRLCPRSDDEISNLNEIYGCPANKKCFARKNILADSVLSDYPYLSNAIWVDSNGRQRIRWTTKPALASLVPVAERSYFQNILADRAWAYNWNQKSHKFFLEPVYSKANGSQQVVLSMPIDGFPDWVSTLDIRALSVLQTVLPRELGYGYCIIDDEGNVLFHSDESRNQVENFFRESDNDGYLRSVVLARESKSMNVQYLGTGHRLFVRPVPNTPWTLVTFRDKQIARAGGLEFIAYAIYLFCLYAMVLLIIFSFYYMWNREDRSALLWPYKKRAVNYYFSIGVNLLLALLFGLAINTLNKWAILFLTLLLPTVGFIFHHYNLRRSADFGTFGNAVGKYVERYTPLNYRHGYVLTLVTLLILVSVLPTLAFFKFAYDREMKLLVGLGQINLARGLEERAERVEAQYSSSLKLKGSTHETAAQLVRKRLSLDHCDVGDNESPTFCDAYAQFFFNSKFNAHAKDSPSSPADKDSFATFFESIVPFKNSISLRIHGLTRSMGAKDKPSLLSQEGDSHRTILRTDERVDGIDDHTILNVESDAPTLGNSERALWWFGLLVILGLVPSVLFLVINFVGKRIFLLNTDEPVWIYGDDLNPTALSQNLLIVASGFTRKNEALTQSGFEVLDLRSMRINEKLVHLRDDKLSQEDNDRIALNHFEYKSEDARINRQKVRLLEYLLARNKRILVASTVDLASYNFIEVTTKRSQEPESHSENGKEGALAVFNSLRRYYLEDRGDSGKFNEVIE